MPARLTTSVVLFVAICLGTVRSHGESPTLPGKGMSGTVATKRTVPFTGKVIGKHVRMRVAANLEGAIVAELTKDDYVVVRGEKEDFYAVESPTDVKAYVFRGFVIDGIVEGDRVNIRLAPDREAPVIGHLSTGTKVTGTVCENDGRWLEIKVPEDTRFYIAKEYVEYVGNTDMKAVRDGRKESVRKLFETTRTLARKELLKPFTEMDSERVMYNLRTVINDYIDFPEYVTKATKFLDRFRNEYLLKKVSFLEAEANGKGSLPEAETNKPVCASRRESAVRSAPPDGGSSTGESISLTDRMRVWEPVEQALYLDWSTGHHAKTIRDFYADQKLNSRTMTGIVETYGEPVKSKPGDYLLKEGNVPVAYLYSTHVNLEEYRGKKVSLSVYPRDNNRFAFPAFYVLSVNG
ncbi:MAG: hypothetical protein OXF02_02970 [Simkaniaceae bacterium]|nr:hypothetical protein [Simkaniaceae bacterium]